MSGRIDPRQLAAMLRADAQKMGISVEELIKRIMGGGQDVVGHLGAGTIPQGPTFISAHGGGVWNDIEPRVQEPIDDFEQLAQDREQALTEGGGDSLAQEILFRRKVHSDLQQQAAFVRHNPVSVLTGLLGSQATVQADAARHTVANWIGEDSETLPVVITFGSTRPVAFDAGTAVFRPFGIIKWGSTGANFSAEVDINQGTQLVVGASSVTLEVAMEALVGSGSMQLAGQLSFHPIVRTAPVTRTRYIDFTVGGNNIVSIPPFAKNFWVLRGTTTGTLQVQIMDNKQNVISTPITLAPAAAMITNPIPIGGDGYFVNVINSDLTNVEVIFGLSL